MPVPEAPEVTDSRDVLLDLAVHAQLGEEAVTPMVPVAPPVGISADVVLSV